MIPQNEEEYQPPFDLIFVLLISSLALAGQFLATVFIASVTGKESVSLIGIGIIVGYGTAVLLAVPRISSPPELWLGFVTPPRVAWLAAGLLIPAVMLASELDNVIKTLLPAPSRDPRPELSGFELFELAVVLIAVVPAAHEIFFRGVLHTALVTRLGAPIGVCVVAGIAGISGGLFAGPSTPELIAGLLQSTALALVLGVLRHCSGSLWPCLALSAALGGIGWLAAQNAFGIPGFDDISAAHTPLLWLAPCAASVGVGLGLCRAMAGQGGLAEGQSRREQSEREENGE